MDELIKQVSTRTGISEDQAKQAVDIVVSHLKTKLPPPVAAQIDGVLSGDMLKNVGNMSQGLGGLSGKK